MKRASDEARVLTPAELEQLVALGHGRAVRELATELGVLEADLIGAMARTRMTPSRIRRLRVALAERRWTYLTEAELAAIGRVSRRVRAWSRTARLLGVSPPTLDAIIARRRVRPATAARVRAGLEALRSWTVPRIAHPGVH